MKLMLHGVRGRRGITKRGMKKNVLKSYTKRRSGGRQNVKSDMSRIASPSRTIAKKSRVMGRMKIR